MSGFAVLYREATDHPALCDANRFGLWCLLLISARWAPSTVSGGERDIAVAGGQVVCTFQALAARLGWNELSAKRCLRGLERAGMLSMEMIGRRVLITILDRSTFAVERMRGDGTGTIDPPLGYVPKAEPVFGRDRDPLSEAERQAIFERDGLTCSYCKTEEGPFEVDHITAVANGGSNHPDNLCVACKPCNRSKGAKPVEEWNI